MNIVCLINNIIYTLSFVFSGLEDGVFEYYIKALNLPKCGFGLFLSQTFLGWMPVVTMILSKLIPLGNGVGVPFECCELNFPLSNLLEESWHDNMTHDIILRRELKVKCYCKSSIFCTNKIGYSTIYYLAEFLYRLLCLWEWSVNS